MKMQIIAVRNELENLVKVFPFENGVFALVPLNIP